MMENNIFIYLFTVKSKITFSYTLKKGIFLKTESLSQNYKDKNA